MIVKFPILQMNKEITFIVGSERIKVDLNFEQALQFKGEYPSILFAKNEIYVKSNVQAFVFQNFLDHFTKSKQIPDDSLYDIDHMCQYYFLNEEFGINDDLISNDKYKELLPFSIIKNLPNSINVNKSNYEQFIASKIDFYIDKYPQYMSKISIQSLFNILSQSTQFNHINVYRFIKSQNDDTYFALLTILDSSKLSKDIVQECISNQEKRFEFVPKNCLQNLIDDNSQLANLNKELNDELNSEKYTERKFYYFVDYLNERDEGIVSFLVRNQNNKYDLNVVASMKSGDMYSLICPDKDGYYGGFFTHTNHKLIYAPVINTEFTIELQSKAKVSSIKFHGPRKDCYGGHHIEKFSYTIYGDDEKILVKNEINKTLLEKSIITEVLEKPVDLKKITVNPIGVENEEIIKWPLFGGVELFSDEHKDGVFKDLIEKSDYKDPHRCGVFISATQYSTNEFYHFQEKEPNMYVICTLNFEKNSWFKIELTKGNAIITGFIFQKAESHHPVDYKIIASIDDKKDEKEWLLLHEGIKESGNERIIKKRFDEYKPAKFIKIVLTGKNDRSNYELCFCHFDIYGFYLPN